MMTITKFHLWLSPLFTKGGLSHNPRCLCLFKPLVFSKHHLEPHLTSLHPRPPPPKVSLLSVKKHLIASSLPLSPDSYRLGNYVPFIFLFTSVSQSLSFQIHCVNAHHGVPQEPGRKRKALLRVVGKAKLGITACLVREEREWGRRHGKCGEYITLLNFILPQKKL